MSNSHTNNERDTRSFSPTRATYSSYNTNLKKSDNVIMMVRQDRPYFQQEDIGKRLKQ